MAVDVDYLDDLMKSIEPIVYPDGVPDEDKDNEDGEEIQMEQEPEDSYEEELAAIPEKPSANQPTESEMEVEAALEAVSEPVEEVEEPVTENVEEDTVVEYEEGKEQEWADINEKPEDIPQEIELDMNMSEEEIDAMLNAARSSANEDKPVSIENDDVTDVLDMLSDDEDIKDIKETLEKSDNNIAVDQSALEEPKVELPNVDSEEDGNQEGTDTDKKDKKKKKEKKQKEKGEKKEGFFARLFNALTEEVPEGAGEIPEQSETGVTDENAKILSELDAEGDGKKKRKKKKKKKGKEEKDQPESEGNERDIREKSDGAEEDGEGDTGKGKKKKKPKKEKKPKEKKEEIPEKPAKKLPKKRVRNTFILCLSILAAIVILAIFLNEYLLKNEARYAFDKADYETAYSDLYGMEELNDEDQEIYNKSQTIMFLQRKVSSYENYMQLGMRAEALNALLEGYDMYPEVLDRADRYGVTDQVNAEYAKIIEGLSSFGLSEADAQEICAYTSAVQYNMRVDSIANGTPYTYDTTDTQAAPETDEQPDEENGALEDILPEEEDFLPDNPEDIFD